MKTVSWLILISLMSLLTSCQVKEGAGSSGLISGHKPATNAFTLSYPASGTYVYGDTLNLTLSFPFPVTVTGSPRLRLNVGGTTRYADFISGDGQTKLHFAYDIVAADNDEDGVRFESIDLNGGSLTFDDKGTIANCSTSIAAQTFNNVIIDNTVPYVTSAAFANVPNYYKVGSAINILVKFNEKVFVSGEPRLRMAINESATANVVYAKYTSGSGTNTLNFTFVVTEDARHNTGNIGFDANIDLNGGAIVDAVDLDANLSLGAHEGTLEATSFAIRFNGTMPVLQNITVPTPATYPSGSTLEFIFEFDRPVNVATGTGGTPTLPIKIGVNGSETIIRQAAYNAANSSSTALSFRYTIVPGDSDADGLQIVETGGLSFLVMTGGATITAQAGGELFVNTVNIGALSFHNHVLQMPDLSNIILNSVLPTVQSVSIAPDVSGAYGVGSSSDEYFKIGENIIVTVNFNDGMIVGQSDGTPSLPLIIGGVTKQATYLSGGDGQTSLVFRYVVEEGLQDDDGIQLGASILLNDGTITNAANTNAELTLPTTTFVDRKVDSIRPVIANVNPPPAGTYSTITNPRKNWLDFAVTWSEPVTISNNVNLPIVVNVTNRNAIHNSGAANINTTFRYTITGADTSDTNGIVMSSPLTITTGSVFDAAGNSPTDLTYTVPDSSNVLVDRIPPTIVSVSPPPPGRYTTGQDLDFVVVFSENVDIAAGPYIPIQIGANTRQAVVSAGTGTDTYTFTYTVQADDTDPDYIDYNSKEIITSSGYIRDAGANALTPRTFTDSISNIEIDEVAPTATASTTARVYVDSADGTGTIEVDVTFSEEVTVDTTGGTPEISLELDTGSVAAVYSGSISPTVKRFSYTIDPDTDMDLNGAQFTAGIINANGATFRDRLENDAVLNLTTITNISGVVVAPHAVLWVKGSTANRSGFTAKPSVTTAPTISGGYFSFDPLAAVPLNLSYQPNVSSLYMALRTPLMAEISGTQNFIETWAVLDSDGTSINMNLLTSAEVQTTSGYLGSGIIHNDVFPENSVVQMKVKLPMPGTLTSPTLIHEDFSGDIAEIIIFDTALSPAQESTVYDYINNAY